MLNIRQLRALLEREKSLGADDTNSPVRAPWCCRFFPNGSLHSWMHFQFYSSVAAETLAMRKLYWYATLVVLAHAVVVLWHLELLARLGSALKPVQVPLFAILAN